MGKKIEDRGLPTLNAGETATFLGKSVTYFMEKIMVGEPFKRNVKDKTPDGRTHTFLRSDLERFKRLERWI